MNYIGGLIDMWWAMNDIYFSDNYKIILEKTKDMTGHQIKKIFEKYLEEHPEELHYGAANTFITAMNEILFE